MYIDDNLFHVFHKNVEYRYGQNLYRIYLLQELANAGLHQIHDKFLM